MNGIPSVELHCPYCGSTYTEAVRRTTDEVIARCPKCGNLSRPDPRPLAELPALVIASARADVRGWTVIAHDGRTFGVVVDLLADPDRLFADVLIVRMADGITNAGRAEALVPLAALEAREDRRQLVPGRGLPPIALCYRSTNALAGYGIAAAALATALAWAFGAFQ